tara:strand:+ start:7654 stop:8595 length:942 start_codon:yes stop_codon:yes gene_type:complete
MGILKNLYNNIFNQNNKSKTNTKIENENVRIFNLRLEELSDPNDTLYDYPYWYSFIKGRAEGARLSSYQNKKEEYESYVFGHADEYSKRLINDTIEEKTRFIKPRIICYGKIYEMLEELIINVKKGGSQEFMNNSVNVNPNLVNQLENEILHAKASLYGAIKFALMNKINIEKILEWYPNFKDDGSFNKGNESMNQILKKIKSLDKKDVEEKKIQNYELKKDKLDELPFWFNYSIFDVGYFEKGRNYKIKNENIKLNWLERSMYFNYQISKYLFDKLPDEMNNYELYIDLYEKNELVKEWFKENNEKAFLILF